MKACDSCRACEQENVCKRDQSTLDRNRYAYESQCSWWVAYERQMAPAWAHEQEMGY